MPEAPLVLLVDPPAILPHAKADHPWFATLAAVRLAGVLRERGFRVMLFESQACHGSNLYPYDAERQLLGTTVPRLLASVEAALEPKDDVASAIPPAVFAVIVMAPSSIETEAGRYEFSRLEAGLRRLLPAAPLIEVDPTLPFHESALPDLNRDAPRVACEFEGLHAMPAWDLISSSDYSAFLAGTFDRLQQPNRFRVAPDTRPFLLTGDPANPCSAWPDARTLRPGLQPETVRRQLAFLRAHQTVGHLALLDIAANLCPEFDAWLDLLEQADLAYDFVYGLSPAALSGDRLARLKGRIGMLTLVAGCLPPTSTGSKPSAGMPGQEVLQRIARDCRRLGIPLGIHVALAAAQLDATQSNIWLADAWQLHEAHGAQIFLHAKGVAPDSPGHPCLDPARGRPRRCVASATGQPDPPSVSGCSPLDAKTSVTPAWLVTALSMFRLRQQAAATRKVIINLTYRCNNHCEFCAVGNRSKEDLPAAAVEKYLQRYFDEGVRLLDFDGGEPTLHPQHLRFIRFAKNLGYREINLTTNGRVLSYEQAAARLVRSGLTHLLISLHAPTPAIQEALTQTPGSFAQTLAGMDNILRLRPADLGFGVNTTVARPNLDHLPALARLLHERGVTHWTLQCLTPFGRAHPALLPDPQALTDGLGRLLDEWADRLGITVINLPTCRLPGHEQRLQQDVFKLERNMIFVDRRQVNLFRYLEARRRRLPDCAACPYAIVCGGHYVFAAGDGDPLSEAGQEDAR